MKFYPIPQFSLLLRNTYFFKVIKLACVLQLGIFVSQGSAQSNFSFTDIPLANVDGTPNSNWESTKNYYIVLNTDLNTTETLLADPNLSEQQRVVNTAYYRMLTYIQTDLINKIPIQNIAVDNFTKVKVEAETDPKLANLDGPAFTALYTSFVEKFHP